ncbi:cyclin-dependent kinase inhibitor 3 [Sinocyclocheilus anshuiensis]|uniref:cyclin-dependent kinase inhibitor 3 n=1 Tax=Sinocyclocheilus anshuiensis TaxID=1608454 RepID=UPI0007B84564|nr:PREDICTED: cyclin-dependent kinase inhibitor 3 [Sinocyclocheilus anshuiensis]
MFACRNTGAMRTSEFDSSDEEDFGEEEATPFQISWLSLSVVECSQSLGICSLPGCRYKEIRRNLQKDVAEMRDQGVEDVFVFCTRGELVRYRVPCLLEVYSQDHVLKIQFCYGGLGRSGLIAACLLLQLSVSMTPSAALEILRELRGGGAIQTIKQYNFLHEFREKFEAYQETKERLSERSVSR